jgi:hypothetical protein
VLAFLIVQLNIYFAWTSRAGSASGFHRTSLVRLLVLSEVNAVTKIQLSIPGVSSYFTSLAHGSRSFGPPSILAMKLFIDSEVIVFTLALFILSLLLFRRKGPGVSFLRAFEITSVAVLPLGIEIYFFDHGQFNIHASDIQVKLGLAWFTNAEVLYLSLSILVVTLLIEVLRRERRKEVAPTAFPVLSEKFQ